MEARPGRTSPPGKTRYPLYRRMGGPRPTGIRSPDRPACSQSLYRLSCPAHRSKYNLNKKLCLTVLYKVVQIWPGLFTIVYTQISPGHIWTTLYIYIYIYIYIYWYYILAYIQHNRNFSLENYLYLLPYRKYIPLWENEELPSTMSISWIQK